MDQEPFVAVHDRRDVRKRVLLRSGDLPFITQFAQATFDPGAVVDEHVHMDMAEVFLVESGTGVLAIDGHEYELAPGVSVTVEAGEKHLIENRGSDPLVLTYFGVRAIGNEG